MSFWESGWGVATGAASGLLFVWLVFAAALWFARPDEATLRGTLRLLPDVVRLVRRLAADPTLPRGIRVRLGLLLAYLVSPIDLVPDFIPVLGYADDAIVVALVLRGVVRRAGAETVARHWPGEPAGLAVVMRLVTR